MHKVHAQSSTSSTGGSSPSYHKEIRIEEGKLFYDKRWFRRGQAIQVEPKTGEKFPALISAIGNTYYLYFLWLPSWNHEPLNFFQELKQFGWGEHRIRQKCVFTWHNWQKENLFWSVEQCN